MNHKKKIQIIKVKSKIKLSVCVTFFYNPIYIRKKDKESTKKNHVE